MPSPPLSSWPLSTSVVTQRSEPEKVRTLQGKFSAAAAEAHDRSDLIGRLSRILVDSARADMVVVTTGPTADQLNLEGILHPVAGLSETTQASFLESARSAILERQTRVGRIGRPPNQLLISVPVISHSSPEVFQVLFLAPVATPDVLTTVIEFAVSNLIRYDLSQQSSSLNEESQHLAAITDLVSRIETSLSLKAACQTVCDAVAGHVSAAHMAIGFLKPGTSHCHIMASSRVEGVVSPDRHDVLLEAACNEAVLRGEIAIWPPRPGDPRHSLATHRQLKDHSRAGSVVSVPLRTHQGEIVGAWLVLLESPEPPPATVNFMRGSATPVGAALFAVFRSEKGAVARVIQQAAKALHHRRGRWLIMLAVACVASLWIPLPYHVRSSCEVQPVSLRYVAAPFEARLLRADVEPGDEVVEGQLLASLDGEEIRVELSGATAEVDRAAKERDGHLADKEINAAQVSRLEMARMGAKADLLRQRSEQLEIRSPVTGVVISGDLRKAVGAPMTMGQTMFEIAPLEEMVLEIGIPEEDINHVAVGQSIEAVLNALPDRTWSGTIERINPRSELVDQDYVFVAEARFSNEHGLLRPGMKGRAKITTARHPLGWNLFHKAIDQARFWTGW